MIGEIKIRLTPREASSRQSIIKRLASELDCGESDIHDIRLIRKSIDARQKKIFIELSLKYALLDDQKVPLDFERTVFKNVDDKSGNVIIIGAGPAGLFAALKALEHGLRPIVIERGKDVESRLRDVVALQKKGELNVDSNFCYGEGGAGAYSDGKLFTRSKKRGNVREVLQLLHQHGAREEILFEAHPHIGSDKLPGIIKNIRKTILEHGGRVLFNTKFQSLILKNHKVEGIVTEDGQEFFGPVILATGHSARDVYRQLHSQGVRMEKKGFAMGARLEHPQSVIDKLRYHSATGKGDYLPPAEYSLSCQVEGRGVYSFCMCPGGVIVPAVSDKNELVVNGMSASARGGRWSNSGMVVEIRPEDFPEYDKRGELGMLELQSDLEKKFYEAANRSLNAPAQRMKDFTEGKSSSDLPPTSYVCGIHPERLDKLFPPFISQRLQKGLENLGRKNKGFLTNDAVLIGLESRTSSPVRIPRDNETRQHPDFQGLYPVGEGAGYAGGIVSAAMDGIKSIEALVKNREAMDFRKD